MSNVEFNEFRPNTFNTKSEPSKMVAFVLKTGIVKDEVAAGKFLAALAVIFFVLSIYIFATYVFGFSFKGKQTKSINTSNVERPFMRNLPKTNVGQ